MPDGPLARMRSRCHSFGCVSFTTISLPAAGARFENVQVTVSAEDTSMFDGDEPSEHVTSAGCHPPVLVWDTEYPEPGATFRSPACSRVPFALLPSSSSVKVDGLSPGPAV